MFFFVLLSISSSFIIWYFLQENVVKRTDMLHHMYVREKDRPIRKDPSVPCWIFPNWIRMPNVPLSAWCQYLDYYLGRVTQSGAYCLHLRPPRLPRSPGLNNSKQRAPVMNECASQRNYLFANNLICRINVSHFCGKKRSPLRMAMRHILLMHIDVNRCAYPHIFANTRAYSRIIRICRIRMAIPSLHPPPAPCF